MSQAEDNCDFNYFLNTATNQCQFCDTGFMYWNYGLNLCVPVIQTPYVDPILGPAGPIGWVPIRSSDRSGRGVGGLGPVAAQGPVGAGGPGRAGPAGPIGIGRR